jgi:glycosyltransferase involved in cell wall biosynthesis
VVYDFDDAIFTLEAPEEGLMARIRAWRRGRALPPMLRAAGHAVVENAYTGAYARQYGPKVWTITGPIDTRRYQPGSREGRGSVVLGWIGSWSTARYLEMIRGPLAEIGRRYPHVRLLLIGAGGFRPEGLEVESRPWSLETEVTDLQRIDVGLAPLPDDPWTRGKGGYKLLQYMAVGLPVVASPVGVQGVIVEEGGNGHLASSDAQWEACLGRLIEDPDLRGRMGMAGREKVVRDYSLERSSPRFREILRSVACRGEQPCNTPSP